MTLEPTIEVLNPGLQSSVQDLGRLGFEHFGVSQSGAFDLSSWRAANRLVGNHTDSTSGGPAAIEVLVGGLRLRLLRQTQVAVAGAHDHFTVTSRTGGSVELPSRTPHLLAGGCEIHLPATKVGLRSYLAVAGGIASPLILGSRSWDSASALGEALKAGDVLPAGGRRTEPTSGWDDDAPVNRADSVEVVPGPHAALIPMAWKALLDLDWLVTPDTSRIGVKLASSRAPSIVGSGHLRSIPTAAGTVQYLPGGGLVVFGPDAPTSGGYAFIGFLPRTSLDRIAQCRPGSTVKFGCSPQDSAGWS